MSEVKISLDNCAEDDREWYENDLQLAAELGMALLKRNQELENIVYQKQLIIDEQLQEIELLTRQAATLRELNDSRLKIYEQLEQSISEVEKINKKLHCESSADKKRIQNLCNSIELLERKCEELESMIDELRISSNKNYPAFSQTDISVFEENVLPAEEKCKETNECFEVIRLQKCLSQLNFELTREQKKYYDLELERDILIQENAELQNALQALETNTSTSFLSSENEKLNEDASEKDVLSTLENNTEVEEQELSSQDCVLVQLQNGIVAYGNRETLETEWDNIEEYCNKKNTVNEISLLTELDAQYRDLTEKYDSLISSRKQVNSDITSFSEIEGLDDSPNSFSVTSMESENIKIPCNSLPYQTNCKYVDIGVQTEISGDINTNHSHKKILNLNSVNPLSGHFDHSCPTYKKLFEEIFSILKRSLQVDETEKSDIKSSSENDKQVFNNEVPNKVTINPNSCRKFTYAEVLLNGKTKQKVIPL